MPITSTQMAGLVGGQQAMFGNMATYAAQISPFAPPGMAPTYTNPMSGAEFPPSMGYLPGQTDYAEAGARAPGIIGGMAAYGAPALGMAGMAMGGRVGGMLDPMTGAMRGFGRGVGWQSGAGWGANLGRVMSGGIGGIARGIGMGAVGMLPGLAIGGAIQYAGGQMMEGAQERNQTLGFLQNQFRFANPAARGGYGFRQEEGEGIHRMVSEMGSGLGTTFQEMSQIMRGTTSMGVFRGVRDAKEFQAKFKETVSALTEIAKTFNTTLAEAMPMFGEARRQGFWTPQDITRHAQAVRQVQATTGLSAQQAQQYTGMAAQMVQGIGGTLQQGSMMGARALGLAGAATFAGTVSQQQLQNAGMGTGAEGAANLAMMMGNMTSRFASSRVGRWTLAAMMGRNGNLDPEAMERFARGEMGVGAIQRMAERNVGGAGTTGRPGGAMQFVENEEELRGQFAERGPEMMAGAIRGLTGGNLYGADARSKLVTRRIIQRFLGGDKRQADLVAQIVRDMPRVLATQAAQTEQDADMQMRQQQAALSDTWQGITRQVGQWWKETVSEPLKKFGSELGRSWSSTWQRASDKIWGSGARPTLSQQAIAGWVGAAETGNIRALTTQFGTAGLTGQVMGRPLTGSAGVANEGTMTQLGIGPTGAGWRGGLIGMPEARYAGADIQRAEALAGASRGEVGAGEARAMGYGGIGEWQQERAGAAGRQYREFQRSNAAIRARLAFGAGRLSENEQMAWRQAQLSYLRSGAAGEAIRRAVSTGDAGKDLAKMLSYGEREGLTGDTGLEGPGGGLAGLRGQELMERVHEIQEGTAIMLGGAGGIPGTGRITGDSMKEVSEHPDTILALKMMRAADTERDPKKAGEMRARATRKLNDAARDTGNGLSEGARKALAEMGSGSAIGRIVASTLGASAQAVDRKAATDVVANRMTRLKRRLGDESMMRLEGMADKSRVARAATDLLSIHDPVKRTKALQELASAVGSDAKSAAEVLTILKAAGPGAGGEELIQTIQGMQEVAGIKAMGEGEEAAATRGRGGGAAYTKATRGLQRFLGGMMGLQGKEAVGVAEGLTTGQWGKGVKERFEAGLRARQWSDDHIKEFMKDAGGGLTAREKAKWGEQLAVGRGLSTMDPAVAARKGYGVAAESATGKNDLGELIKTSQISRDYLRMVADNTAAIVNKKEGVGKGPSDKDK